MNSLSLIVLAIAGLTAVSAQEPCTGLEIMACEPLVKLSLDPKNRGWMETQENLAKHCSIERALFQCLYEKIAPCADAYNPHMATYLRDQLMLYENICVIGKDFNTKYIKYAKCMNEHDSTVEGKCGSVRHFENPANIEEDCKTFEPALECYLNEVAKTCGEDARDFVAQTAKPSANFAKAVCAK